MGIYQIKIAELICIFPIRIFILVDISSQQRIIQTVIHQ